MKILREKDISTLKQEEPIDQQHYVILTKKSIFGPIPLKRRLPVYYHYYLKTRQTFFLWDSFSNYPLIYTGTFSQIQILLLLQTFIGFQNYINII
jgi:hypothetical protein